MRDPCRRRVRLVGAFFWLAAAGCGIDNRYWLYSPGDLQAERDRSQVIAQPLSAVWWAAERHLAELHAVCPDSDRQSGLLTCSLPDVAGTRAHARKAMEGVTYVTVLLRPVSRDATSAQVSLHFRSHEENPQMAWLNSNGRFEREFLAALAAGAATGGPR